MVIIIKFILFILFIAVIGFFAGSETALTSLRWSRVKKLIRDNRPEALALKVWFSVPDRLLTSLLIGNAAVVILAAVISVSLVTDIAHLRGWDAKLAIGISTPLVIVLILIFGEVTPKTMARIQAEEFSLKIIRPLLLVEKALSPFVQFFMFLSRPVLKLFPAQQKRSAGALLSEDDIKTIVRLSVQEGTLHPEEEKMIHHILAFGETEVHEVMIPRVDIKAVDINGPAEEIFRKISGWGLSRIPAYKKNLDNIVGIIYAKDILNAIQYKELIVPYDLLRPAHFVPESKKIDDLLIEFQQGGGHLAIVVDEYGGTAGLVTIEDLVEEITGEIWDEYDIKEKTIQFLKNGMYKIKAKEDLNKINEELGLDLPAEEFDTVGGLVVDLFGRVPMPGEFINYQDLVFKVLDSDKRRVRTVLIKKIKEKERA